MIAVKGLNMQSETFAPVQYHTSVFLISLQIMPSHVPQVHPGNAHS